MTFPHNEADHDAQKPKGPRRDPETGERLKEGELSAAEHREYMATLLPRYPKWDSHIFGALKGRWLEKQQRETVKRGKKAEVDEGGFFGGQADGG
jgi:hypothetical protein